MSKVIKYSIFILLALIATGLLVFMILLSPKAPESPFEPIFINKNNELVYTGEIDKEGFIKLKLLYEDAKHKPTKLVVTSSGGDLRVGMEMGFWIYDNKLSVEVTRYCISTCANYIFTSGREKILGSQAIVIWHGGAHQSNLLEQAKNIVNNIPTDDVSINDAYQASYKNGTKCQPNQSKDECGKIFKISLDYLKFNESLFFSKLGIDPNLPYYGQLPYYTDKINVSLYSGFYYSLKDLEAMGVFNVHIKNGEWKPELNPHYKKTYKAEISRDPNVRTDAVFGMEAFNDILRDYVASHGIDYTVSELLSWYVNKINH